MRAALWFSGLFAAAVAVALFAGNNQGTVTLFWPPWRIDLSLNMVLLLLVAAFSLLYGALRGLDALFTLPRQARRWRLQQKERAMHSALLDALAHLMAGRFLRARKAAQAALLQEQALADSGQPVPHQNALRTLAHLTAADSSHALRDRAQREHHLQQALQHTGSNAQGQVLREGLHLRAARWALDERDSADALERLAALPQGAARRTLALRMRLKASRLAQHTATALKTARLLGKHHAFSRGAAQSIVRGLALELIQHTHDSAELQQVWRSLEPAERAMPDLVVHAAQRLCQLHGDPALARAWLLPLWEQVQRPGSLPAVQENKYVRALEAALTDMEAPWFARIEAASQAHPRAGHLTYLAATACRQRQLWGKAQQLFTQATQDLQDGGLRASAWHHLAELAEQRADTDQAAHAWKQAALAQAPSHTA